MSCTIDSLSEEQIEEIRRYEEWLDSIEESMPDEDCEIKDCIGPMPYQS